MTNNDLIAFLKTSNCNPLSLAKFGLEKEGLRITTAGGISQTKHPLTLGSKLTNNYITTDYSEALLELITPTYTTKAELLKKLDDIHAFVHLNLTNELLFNTSMPCKLSDDSAIPIANYGKSNIGMMKSIYRRGLTHRYGKFMQTIAGIHYNFSFSDEFWHALKQFKNSELEFGEFKNQQYMALVRNFSRNYWLLLLLYGASPAIDKSFDKTNRLDLTIAGQSYYGKLATSLRMSSIGYTNKKQKDLHISLDSVQKYCHDLLRATQTAAPEFVKKPLRINGDYEQLNQNILQIEAEYYSAIRPKRTPEPRQRPTTALLQGGVEYLELRCLDVDPFARIGVTQAQLNLIDIFLVYCAFTDSPIISRAEQQQINSNIQKVTLQGRSPGLQLTINNKEQNIKDASDELSNSLASISRLLHTPEQQQETSTELAKLHDYNKLTSTKVINSILNSNSDYVDFAISLAQQNQAYYVKHPLTQNKLDKFTKHAQESLIAQEHLENNDKITLSQEINNYLNS